MCRHLKVLIKFRIHKLIQQVFNVNFYLNYEKQRNKLNKTTYKKFDVTEKRIRKNCRYFLRNLFCAILDLILCFSLIFVFFGLFPFCIYCWLENLPEKPSLVNTNIGKHCFYNLENSLDHIKLTKTFFLENVKSVIRRGIEVCGFLYFLNCNTY